MNEKLVKKLFKCEAIEALLLGGSRATGVFDEKSDYDYYIYLNSDLPETKRREILDEFVCYMEYSNKFWELEDDGTLNNGIDVEFIYRTMDNIEEMMDNLLLKGNIPIGYSTCFVDNLLKSIILFDKNDRIKNLRQKYSLMLTDELFDKVIYTNFPLLMDKMPSLYYQIEKAFYRNDVLSINHRSSAYFDIYFDVLFALNRITHPGEKRMLEMALTLINVPKDIDKDIEAYFTNLHVDKEKSLGLLYEITKKLYTLLLEKGYKLTLNSYRKKR